MASTTIQVQGEGLVALPSEVRQRYDLREGTTLTLLDLGGGSLLLIPFESQLDRLGAQVSQAMEEADVTLEEMLAALDEDREQYFRDHFVQP